MVESIASEKTNLSRYRTRISIHQACELFISRWNEEDKRETAVSAGAFFNRLHKRETHRKNGPEGWKPFPFPVFLISMPRVVVFRARDDTETMAGLGATRVPWILITFPSLDSSETRPPSKSCSSRPNVIYVIIFRDNGTRVIRIRYLFSLTPWLTNDVLVLGYVSLTGHFSERRVDTSKVRWLFSYNSHWEW